MNRRPTWLEGVLLLVALGFFFAWCDRGSAIGRLQRNTDVAPLPIQIQKSLAQIDASVDSLQFKLALSNETDFERAPVAYRCDYVGCSIDCGGGK